MSIESVLTPRLRAIADCIPSGAVVADVGTDHGYIPVYLCKTGQIERGLAMDLRPGPLSRAQHNIERYGLTGQIETRLSDGLVALQIGEADTAVIAGMGGLLIAQILEQAPFYLDAYILQPMTATAELRQYLESHGYRITHERLAREDDKLYTIMTVKRGTMYIPEPVFYQVGQRLMANRDPLTPMLIAGLLTKYRQTLLGLAHSNRDTVEEKKEHISYMIQALEALEEVCKTW